MLKEKLRMGLYRVWEKFDGFVVGVSILVWMSVIDVWLCVLVPWKWWESPFGITNIFLFNLFSLGCVYNYYAAIYTDPGYARKDWVRTALTYISPISKKKLKCLFFFANEKGSSESA